MAHSQPVSPGGGDYLALFRALSPDAKKQVEARARQIMIARQARADLDRMARQEAHKRRASSVVEFAFIAEALAEADGTITESEMPTCPSNRGLLADDGQVSVGRELKFGERVGEYTIEQKLGRGSFGCVYRAVHPLIGKQVAIKVLNRACSSDPLIVSRFITEARAVNEIRHRNIVDIFACGQLADGRHYHIMELLVGCTLEQYLARRIRLELAEAVPILRGVARAMDAAHAKGIAHRDLKPANVHLTIMDDEEPFPKVIDFGIAKLRGVPVPKQHQTAAGAIMGTPQYMAPEQCGGNDVDHRADIYAFGVMAYQLLSGRLPFTGEGTVEILWKQISQEALPLSQISPSVTPEVNAIVMQLLEKDREKRPQSLMSVVARLEALVTS